MSYTTTIEVNRLRCRSYHGCFAQERILGGDFDVTLHVTVPADAGCDDKLEGTVNYAGMCTLIRRVMAEPSSLLEHVCLRMREAVKENYPMVVSGHVRVAKLHPPISGVELESVAVSIDWK